MGRDSRGRAQEAQWKLMLQGTQASVICTQDPEDCHSRCSMAATLLRLIPEACAEPFLADTALPA